MYVGQNREQALGCLIIDWEKRETTWAGMDGCGPDWSQKQVLDYVKENAKPGNTVWYLIFWHDENQLCVHNKAGFLEETSAEEEEDDDGAD